MLFSQNLFPSFYCDTKMWFPCLLSNVVFFFFQYRLQTMVMLTYLEVVSSWKRKKILVASGNGLESIPHGSQGLQINTTVNQQPKIPPTHCLYSGLGTALKTTTLDLNVSNIYLRTIFFLQSLTLCSAPNLCRHMYVPGSCQIQVFPQIFIQHSFKVVSSTWSILRLLQLNLHFPSPRWSHRAWTMSKTSSSPRTWPPSQFS